MAALAVGIAAIPLTAGASVAGSDTKSPGGTTV